MDDKLLELIRYGSESHTLDFKEIQYPVGRHEKKNELLKDICAMANHPSNEEKYIIIGVKTNNGLASSFHNLAEIIDESKYQQFVHSNIDPPINFEYKPVMLDGIQLAVFRIFSNVNRPYLFKRDLDNPVRHEKNEFRIGDGYIRQGSSTRKLTREDLELIYKGRYTARDRKTDLKVSAHVVKSEDEEIAEYDLSCLDFVIENQSARSIELDIEVKIVKTEKFVIVQECTLKKDLEIKRTEARKAKDPYSLIVTPNVNFSFDVSFQETESHFVATRDKRRGERTAISIPQHDQEKNAFCQELVLICDGPITVEGQVIIRSDDFSEGVWIQSFSIDHQPSSQKNEII